MSETDLAIIERATANAVASSSVVCDDLEWPDEPGLWTRDGEEWTAKRTADGEMWIIPPDPEDGCVPRMLAELAQPPVLGRWFRSHTAEHSNSHPDKTP